MIELNDFLKLDIRVGEIIKVEEFNNLTHPAYKIWVDFGQEIGIKKTSAQIRELYKEKDLLNKQILGIVNIQKKQVKDYMSEFLLLGVYSNQGVVLITPDKTVNKGEKIG